MTMGNGSATATVVSQAMTRVEPETIEVNSEKSFRREMEPHSLEALYKVAGSIAKIGLCGVSSPEEAMVRMLTGRELGLTMMQSLRGVYVIEGNPSLSASLKQSICLAHPEVCEDFHMLESTAEKATYRVKRKGEPEQDFTWTMERAKGALLVDRGKDPKQNNWNKYPTRMLQARAKSEAADVVFPDLLLGFATKEEMEDLRIQVRETRADPVTGEIIEEVVPSPVAAAPRDYEAECQSLKKTISEAKSKDDKRAVRKAIAIWDGGEPWIGELETFYNLCHAPKAAAAAAAATPAAPKSEPKSAPATREPGEEG